MSYIAPELRVAASLTHSPGPLLLFSILYEGTGRDSSSIARLCSQKGNIVFAMSFMASFMALFKRGASRNRKG
jgi:hypothetical protein